MKTLRASAVLLTFTLLPVSAHAQSDFVKGNLTKFIQKVGVHLNVSVREPLDGDITKGTTFGASVGFGSGGGNGWKYPFGYTSFSENLHGPDGQQFAVLKAQAIYGGIGYGWTLGPLDTGVALHAGYSFNHGRFDGVAAQRSFVADGPVAIDIGNAPFLRPHVKAEYFLTRKFSLRTTAGYVITRPNIMVMTPSGPVTDRWHASNLHASFGIGFYPFRKAGSPYDSSSNSSSPGGPRRVEGRRASR